jgi:glycerol-3-phosphate dehydrogenase (NAD+)
VIAHNSVARFHFHNPIPSLSFVDGITDLEAVRSTEGADLFIGYGGMVERSAVAEEAEWYVYHHDDLTRALKQSKVC